MFERIALLDGVHPLVLQRLGMWLSRFYILNTSTFITRVRVNASWIQRVGQWRKDNSGIVVLVTVTIGTALISIIKWGGELGQVVRDTSAKWRGTQKEEN